MHPRMEMGWGALLLLLAVAAAAHAGDTGPTPGTTGEADTAKRKTVVLQDVAAAQALIDSSEISVIGFFKDLEGSEVKDYISVVEDLQGWACGISTNPEVLAHFNINCSTVAYFRQVDDHQDFLEIKDSKDIDANKLNRFLTINDLRLVTEYTPVSAVGLFNSLVRVHLLLFLDKSSPSQQDALKPFREAAAQLRGKVLCVLVDSTVKGNKRVISYFHLTRAELPAAAIFRVESDEQEVMEPGEISAERLVDFTNHFLEWKGKEKQESADPDDKIPKTEL